MRLPALFALNFLFNASNFANRILLSLLALKLGASPAAIGVLGAMWALFPAVLAVVAGRLHDRHGPRYLMLFGAVGTCAGMVLPAIWPSLAMVMLAAAVGGMAQLFFTLCTQNLAGSSSTKEERPRTFANYSLTISAGSFIGPLLGGAAIDYFTVEAACLWMVALAAIPLAMLLPHLRSLNRPRPGTGGRKHSAAAPPGSALALLRNADVRRTLYTGSLLNAGLNLFQFYMPVYAVSVGISATLVGVIMAMNSTAAFVVRVLMPWLIRRWGDERVLAGAFAVGTASLALVPFFTGAWLLAAVAFLFGLGMGLGQPIVTMQMYNNSPEGRSGEGIGLKMTANQLTKTLSPLLFGVLATALGIPATFWLNALLMGSGGWLGRSRGKSGAARND